ncbi:unnamed protein product [Camellia sinensis]
MYHICLWDDSTAVRNAAQPPQSVTAPGQKFFEEMQNMVKEFKNLVFQVFLFFNICKAQFKTFYLIHLYILLNIFNFYL